MRLKILAVAGLFVAGGAALAAQHTAAARRPLLPTGFTRAARSPGAALVNPRFGFAAHQHAASHPAMPLVVLVAGLVIAAALLAFCVSACRCSP